MEVGRHLVTATWLVLCVCCANAQDEFMAPIECYECEDEAVNTTCSEAVAPEIFNTTICPKGACIKWTFYRKHVLLIRRTCSEKINLNIHLSSVCRTERYGNGHLCMCGENFCNKGSTAAPYNTLLWIFATALALGRWSSLFSILQDAT